MATARDNLQQWMQTNRMQHSLGWKNFSGTINLPNALVVDINNERELIRLVKMIANINHGITKDEDKLIPRPAAGWSDHPQATEPSEGCCSCFTNIFNFFSRAVRPWAVRQAQANNESFSFSKAVPGDADPDKLIIVRFSPEFQQGLRLDEEQRLVSPAGATERNSLDLLKQSGRCLQTGSMITENSNIGLGATGGLGTGFDNPSFGELMQEFTLINAEGNKLSVNEQEFILQRYNAEGTVLTQPIRFKTLKTTQGERTAAEVLQQMRGGHLGLAGIFVEAKFKTVPNYGVCERRTVYKSAEEMFNDLNAEQVFSGQLSDGKPYYGFTAMGMVTDSDKPMWELRRWENIPYADIPNPDALPNYDPKNATSFWQQIETELGSKFMQALLNVNAGELIRKAFLRLAARFAIGAETISDKQVKPTYGEARKMEHYQVGFPKDVPLHEISTIVPMAKGQLKELVPDIMTYAETLARKYWHQGKTPVMFAFYLRIVQGTNGGLSTTAHGPDEKVMVLDMTTHPKAPGLAEFQKDLVDYIEKRVGCKVRSHLGKTNTVEGRTYQDFLPAGAVEGFNSTLDALNALDNISFNPFMTGYHAHMLSRQAMPKQEFVADSIMSISMSEEEVAAVFREAKERISSCGNHLIDEQGKRELLGYMAKHCEGKSVGMMM